MSTITYELELRYQEFLMGAYPTKKPIVAVRISAGPKYLDTSALVDSGADYSIFDAQFAEALGLVLTNGKPIPLVGLDGNKQDGYLHPVAIRIIAASKAWQPIKGEVIFKKDMPSELGNLLGRHDFFQALMLGFDERRQKLHLGQA